MDLLMDTFYQRYRNCIDMLSLIMSILFPCFSLLLLQLSFIPAFILLLTTAVLGSTFVGQRLTVQKRE